ncbi:MAG: IS1 family transposase [Bacteroidota bacterium]|jgi:IS1 family transposase
MNVLSQEKQALVLSHLVEGVSIRSIERLTGVNRNTIMSLLVKAGEIAREIQDAQFVNLKSRFIQVDEIWTYCGKKQKQLTAEEKDGFYLGDQYVFVAIDSETKLAPSFFVGKRNYPMALTIMNDLKYRIPSRFQLSTDSFTPYFNAVDRTFGEDVEYGQIHKIYQEDVRGEKRYSPASIREVIIRPLIGNPTYHKISTSHIERQNLTMRMSMRRFTRLTNAFSKKFKNLEAAVSLHFFYYNFMRIHSSLRVTPAMEAKITNRMWNWADLLNYSVVRKAV